jgi:mannose-1-phosphate guanylyltransferase
LDKRQRIREKEESMADGSLWAVVLAGGSGKRLRPVVESMLGESLPKQYCRFRGPDTLLQLAVRRVLPLVPPSRVVVIVATEHRRRAEEQLRGFPDVRIVDQPRDRGTAAGVLLPLTEVLAADPAARVLLAPTDHVFLDEELALRGIAQADRAVADRLAQIVLFGVVPNAPHGDYGWIEVGDALGSGLHRVDAFREKPGVVRATELQRRGALWNTMILLARGAPLRDLFQRHLPHLDAAFRAYAKVAPRERARFLAQVYEELESFDFSRDLLGRADGLAVHAWPFEVGWSDVGTPPRLFAWLGNETAVASGQPA